MTPRERAEAALGRFNTRWTVGSGWTLSEIYQMVLDDVEAAITEHVRALLADDEATIEMMARALVIRTAEHYGDPLPPIDLDLSLTKLLARAVLAALRRKALGELA